MTFLTIAGRWNRLKNEIQSLKKEITKTEIKSSSALDQIRIIRSGELALLNKARILLMKEATLLRQQIDENQRQLQERKNKLQAKSGTIMPDRRFIIIKHGKLKDLEILLTASSFQPADGSLQIPANYYQPGKDSGTYDFRSDYPDQSA